MAARNRLPIFAGDRGFLPCRGGFYIRPEPAASTTGPGYFAPSPDAPPTAGTFGDGASNTSVRTGGYKIRPYGPASGFLVGAACMAARTGYGGMWACRPTELASTVFRGVLTKQLPPISALLMGGSTACRKSLFATLCVFLNFLKSLKIRVD